MLSSSSFLPASLSSSSHLPFHLVFLIHCFVFVLFLLCPFFRSKTWLPPTCLHPLFSLIFYSLIFFYSRYLLFFASMCFCVFPEYETAYYLPFNFYAVGNFGWHSAGGNEIMWTSNTTIIFNLDSLSFLLVSVKEGMITDSLDMLNCRIFYTCSVKFMSLEVLSKGAQKMKK